jgi:hypothetical protein
MFLFLNTRTILQPMDQWVITNFKAYYLKEHQEFEFQLDSTVNIYRCVRVCVCVTICILKSDLHKIQLTLDFLECNYWVSWGGGGESIILWCTTNLWGVLTVALRTTHMTDRLTAVCLLIKILMSWLTFSGTDFKINSIFPCSFPINNNDDIRQT